MFDLRKGYPDPFRCDDFPVTFIDGPAGEAVELAEVAPAQVQPKPDGGRDPVRIGRPAFEGPGRDPDQGAELIGREQSADEVVQIGHDGLPVGRWLYHHG